MGPRSPGRAIVGPMRRAFFGGKPGFRRPTKGPMQVKVAQQCTSYRPITVDRSAVLFTVEWSGARARSCSCIKELGMDSYCVMLLKVSSVYGK
jgi:hypothetical protein